MRAVPAVPAVVQDMKEKELIAGELAAAEQRLASTYRGLTLLRRWVVGGLFVAGGRASRRIGWLVGGRRGEGGGFWRAGGCAAVQRMM